MTIGNDTEDKPKRKTNRKGIASVVGGSEKLATEFAEYYFKQLEEATIEAPSDIKTIILDYQEYCLQRASRKREEFEWPVFSPMYGLDMRPGILQIYGPPDSYKTRIGIEVANWFSANTNLNIAYIDAENKLISGAERALKGKNIFIIPGRTDTDNIIKKLVIEEAVNVIIIDTIISVTRFDKMLRTILRYADKQGIYILGLNQTRYDVEGPDLSPAGHEKISEFAYKTFYIQNINIIDKYIYLQCTNGLSIAFDKETLDYKRIPSAWRQILDSGEVVPSEKGYIYKEKEYTSPSEVMKAFGISAF
jgi:hypothetical protein